MNHELTAEPIITGVHDQVGGNHGDGKNTDNSTDSTDSTGDADSVASGVESVEPTKISEERHTSGLYDVPSRRLSLLVEGRDYLKYRETFERLLFSEKMTPAQKDAKILKLAMTCLTEKMDEVSAATGEPFIKAEMLAG